MGVPSVSEEEWLRVLATCPPWSAGSGPVLIVAPHPDDETLGAGGLIASLCSKHADVEVAAVTDGEKAYGFDPALARTRVLEQACALKRLGVQEEKIFRLGLPDGGVASCESELAERLRGLMSTDTLVVATWKGDLHPDHEACGRAAERAAHEAGAQLISYFFWTWHWGQTSNLAGLELRRFLLDEEGQRSKAEALLCHRSQLERADGKPILPESLLAPARRFFEVFAV